ncbi:30S ribosomal protein S17 [bacterium E08(2017)]|nr:30S ribosomal protein S17 [bacterium E08(2017)]
MPEVTEAKRGMRKQRSGVVVSKSGQKTIVVLVERRKQHPLYKKVIRQFKKYHVHDEKDEAQVGDRVKIVETRPMSKLKRWRFVGKI